MTTMQGPVEDHRIGELLSIAKSIETPFPTAAETLRAIAASIKDQEARTEPAPQIWSVEEADGELLLIPIASEELGRLLAPGTETIYFFQETP